ncbi:MAG: SGNH/GDSL hydrolase family protein [Bryobacterales bacterium]|nr:SGNH/GDSL hydrolase family protein [Bryobacterales bacterium]
MRISRRVTLGGLAGTWAMQAQNPAREPGAATENPAFAPIEDTPGLPRVLLIGDSISIGYTLFVREILAGKVNVHRIPTNAGPTTKGIENIDSWLGKGHWDLIHFNWGLHDLKYMFDDQPQVDLAQYERNLARLVGRLRKTGARLIWASTTPVPNLRVGPKRIPDDVPRYNEAAARVMKQYGVPTDDLYTFAMKRLAEIQIPDNVHFKPEGSRALAEQVASAILAELPGRPTR